MALTDVAGNVTQVQAISWAHQVVSSSQSGEMTAGVRITTWCDVDGATYLRDHAAARAALRRVSGQLAPAHSAFFPYEVRFAPRGAGAAMATDDVARWLHAWLAFIVTKVAARRRAPAARQAARRAMRSLKHDTVTVVTLRESVPAPPPEDHVPATRDWRSRWWVDPFHRHLGNYAELGYAKHKAEPAGPGKECAVCGLGTTPVSTYLKGPTHLPIKARRRKVYRVAR
jgi:hypothetical protein